MKKITIVTFAFSALAGSTIASAAEGSSCHFHGSKPAPEKVVVDCAAQRKTSLIGSGKLDKSWESVAAEKAEMIDGKKGKEWKVSFKNPKVTEADKSTLYVFMSPAGNYIAANFTGN